MQVTQRKTRGRRRAACFATAIAAAALASLASGPAHAHDTDYCGHTSPVTIGGWTVTLTGSEWVGSQHYHYYRHTSGPNAHTETNNCTHMH